MTQEQLVSRKQRAENGTVIVSRTEDGFRVYSIQNPSKVYLVRQEGERWTCTCPDFEFHKADTTWRCKHILAVAPWVRRNGDEVREHEATEIPEPSGAVQPDAEGESPKKRSRKISEPLAQMLIKRSVSPDGRIDSVSVEFSVPVSGDSNGEIKDKALTTLKLQRDIVGTFLKLNGQKSPSKADQSPEPAEPERADGKPVPARMTDIAKVSSKWGERYCINIQVNGRRTRLFGSAEELATQLAAAGYEIDSENIQEGLRLNVPCRVTLKPSADGKYLNVEQVFPVARKVSRGGRHDSAFA